MNRKRTDKALATALQPNMILASHNQNGANEIIYKEFTTTVANLRASTNIFYPFVFINDVGKEGIFKYDSTDTTSVDDDIYVIVDGKGKRWKRASDIVNSKLQYVTSIANLQAYTQSSLCHFDGSVWERKSGNVNSNGGAYAGTLIRVNSVTYWERKENEMNIAYFGGKVDGTTDDSQSFTNALDYLNSKGGGVLNIPKGICRANILINYSNIIIRGQGGAAELFQTRIIPTDITKPTIQVSNGTQFNKFCRIENLAISGSLTNGQNGVSALKLGGGTYYFTINNVQLVDGEKTLHIEPSGGFPVSVCFFNNFFIRNDLNLSTSRAIYMKRNADPEYVTSIVFSNGHVNKPNDGYWAELNGTGSPGVDLKLAHVYVDHKDGWGVMLKGGNCQIQSTDSHLDPGINNGVIVERDDNSKNIGNTFNGVVHHGGQKIKLLDGSYIVIPAEVDAFYKKIWTGTTYTNLPMYFTNIFDPLNQNGTAPFLDSNSPTGSITLSNSDLDIKTVGKGFRIKEGTNAKQGYSDNMISGFVTISNTSITNDSRIFVSRIGNGDIGSAGSPFIVGQTTGVGFTVKSTNINDTARVAFIIFEPAL